CTMPTCPLLNSTRKPLLNRPLPVSAFMGEVFSTRAVKYSGACATSCPMKGRFGL
ncbi:hypothetical protein AJOOGB_AJOOGB_15065, partial [Dysosmobacter welbionis]